MKSTSWLPGAAVSSLILVTAGCGSNPRAQVPGPKPAAPAPVAVTLPPPPQAAVDPVVALIATSERHFNNGRRQVELGHLNQAKLEFDRAVNVLLESPWGARTELRIREHFDRLVDRISAFEQNALAQGDGFTEKNYEPATRDELLAVTTFDERPAEAAPQVEAAVQKDLASAEHDIPIPLNERVLGYVELFQGKLRSFIEDGIQRGSRYLPMIQNVFRAEGLPLDLAYIPLIESAFKPNALSRAKAKGVWQFMRGTALENGLKTDWYIDERSDPEKATYAAAKYLRTLSKMFDGDWHLAMAAYNGGPGRVERAAKRAGISDFWELTRSTRHLPRETREYVPMILAAIIVAKNPSEYGLNITTAEPISYEKVRVPRAVDLRRVAEWTGSTIQDIQALNPELRRWTTPVRYPDYEVKVPSGTAEMLRARLEEAAPSDFTALKWYSVKPGESLATIARKLRVSRTDLAEANNISIKSRVRAGQELVIPRAPATALTARLDRSAPAPEDAVLASRSLDGTASTREDDSVVTERASKTIYRVKKGDTLSSIARLFRTSVTAIKTWNRNITSRLRPGDRLTIFASLTRATN